ncbi:MAG: hypothetical protein ACFFD4_30895 [Candidatus Odinarchaeota archaeon]
MNGCKFDQLDITPALNYHNLDYLMDDDGVKITANCNTIPEYTPLGIHRLRDKITWTGKITAAMLRGRTQISTA